VIITGGIDLSVGSLVAFTGVMAGVTFAGLAGQPDPLVLSAGFGAAILGGTLFGAFHGAVITRFGLPPFLVTLAGMLIARGLAFILCGGEPVYEGFPPALMQAGRGFVAEGWIGRILPIPVLVTGSGLFLFHFVLTRTVYGRSVIAIGSNVEAARLSGIGVGPIRASVYLLTGALCGLVGALHTGKLMAADPKVGEMWELNVIAAVVVGGTSLFGGRGSITGTVVGALIIGVLNNSLNLLHVQHFWQKVVLGAVILLAALLDAALEKLGTRRRR
jgi:ribose transport system permease protein